ncbi:thiamine diphosphokinase [Lactobacillaceae bacterium 24-114]
MRVNIMVGGPQEMIPEDKIKHRVNEKWIGVDIGATRLLKLNIQPSLAIGDFDSTSDRQFSLVKSEVSQIKTFPPEKDFTDTQLGVKSAIDVFHPDQIDIFGATGGRLDQLLSNVFLPVEIDLRDYTEKIRLIDTQNIVNYYLPGKHTINAVPGFKYLAFVNLTPVSGLTLIDEKYSLNDWSSPNPFSWSSNEFTAEKNHFSFDEGIVAVIQSNDLIGK